MTDKVEVKLTFKIALIVSFLLGAFTGLAQNEANWWFFGSKAGLNFNIMVSGLPTTSGISPISTSEGCAAISDANGNLLFYTDGRTVWDRNHSAMTNGTGLRGHSSSTQSGVIVPFPNNKKKFYVFTADAIGASNNGIKYSVVDMNLRSGLGDVVSTRKNVNVFNPACERITATARNGGGYWVIAQQHNSNRYNAYAVTNSGVSTTPVISTLGPVPSNINGLGYMKASPTGDKVAVCYYSTGASNFLMDFNPRTGALSNVKRDNSTDSYYGLEFSPDGKKLYVAPYAKANIYQYDATTTTSTAYVASKVIITTTGMSGNKSSTGGTRWEDLHKSLY